jgi:hypothetical protein
MASHMRAKYMSAEGKVSLAGFPEVDSLRNPYSDKDDLIYVGERNYDDPLLKPLEGVREHRTDGSLTANKASKYVRRILHALNKELIRQGGVKLKYRDLEIGEMENDEIEMRGRDGQVIGHVLGYFDTITKKLKLNPYLTEAQLEKVTVHEIFHYAQDKLGIIGNYERKFGQKARAVIEAQTDQMVEKVMTDIYTSKQLDWLNPARSLRV